MTRADTVKPRRPKFGLRFLLICFTLAAVGSAWLGSGIRKANREMEIAQRYRCSYEHSPDGVRFAHDFESETSLLSPVAFLRRYTANNLFSPVTHIHVSHKTDLLDETGLDLSRVESVELHYIEKLEDLSCLDRCQNIKSLGIFFCNVDKIEGLEKFSKLEEVRLWTTGKPTEILPQLKQHRIKTLEYNKSGWKPEEIELFCQFEHLEVLNLGTYWSLKEEYVAKLKTRLPNVQLIYQSEK